MNTILKLTVENNSHQQHACQKSLKAAEISNKLTESSVLHGHVAQNAITETARSSVCV